MLSVVSPAMKTVNLKWFILLISISYSQQVYLKYSIKSTWDGQPLVFPEIPVNITLELAANKIDLLLNVEAPYYNNPAPDGVPGKPFYGLYKHEVVEAYLYNEENQYFQIQINPHGQYMVLLFNGLRNPIQHSLPLQVTTSIEGNVWNGTAIIPRNYLPSKPTLFNAHATHEDDNGKQLYRSLYPRNNETQTTPNYHSAENAQPIALSIIDKSLFPTTVSQIWKDALDGKRKYSIKSTWDAQPLNLNAMPVNITLKLAPNQVDLQLDVLAPFFNDSAPNNTPEIPFFKLYEYEAVEFFFFNKEYQYLQIQFGPYGHHMIWLFNGDRNKIQHSLPLKITTHINGNVWNATTIIPRDYLPQKPTKFNAHAVHGVKGESKENWSLYPTLDKTLTHPDFHSLDTAEAIDLRSIDLFPKNVSQIWKDALDVNITYSIKSTWDAQPLTLTDKHVNITLKLAPSQVDLQLEVVAPFFNDSAPNGTAEIPFFNLYKYEAVEFFFFNKEYQYLQIQLGPYGHHMVWLFNGDRNNIQHSLPLKVTTHINGNVWNVTTIIPRNYLPQKPTEFNAHAVHGVGESKENWSLYPTLDKTLTHPDFHSLANAAAIDLKSMNLFPKTVSQIWKDALDSDITYSIKSTWDAQPLTLPDKHVNITLKLAPNQVDLQLDVAAPFFDDSAPNKKPEIPFFKLYEYEAVEFYFFNEEYQYLQIQFGPYGHHMVLLLNGERRTIKDSLPLKVTTHINGNVWNGTTIIPKDYLPQKPTKFNAHAVHGVKGESKEDWSLYPTVNKTLTHPDFHSLAYAQPIDLKLIDQSLYPTTFSQIWKDAIDGAKSKRTKKGSNLRKKHFPKEDY